MCLGGGSDHSKDLARAKSKKSEKTARQNKRAVERDEKQRQRLISRGKDRIDSAFDRRYDNKFFRGYRKDYRKNYLPEVENQYKDAQGKLVAALAGRGQLESTEGARALRDLKETRDTTRADIADRAFDASGQLRRSVEDAKGNLYTLNESSADPRRVAAQARGRAAALAAPQAYTPLGRVFAASLQPWASYAGARANAPAQDYVSPYSSPSGSGSQRVIT